MIVRKPVQSGLKLDVFWLFQHYPKAVGNALQVFDKYYSRIRSNRLRKLIEVTLQAGIYDYPWKIPYLFPR